jgi:uracil-DNA glycosylase family 4
MSLDQAVNASSPLARRLITQHWRESQVKANIMICNECQLGEANRVPFTGSTWTPDLVLLGEAPGANEDRVGKPFVGRAGKLLDEMLERVGTSRKRCVITNSVCCRPPSNRDPEWSEILACEPNRLAQTKLARTVVGVAMGRIALSVLKRDPAIKIGANRSKPFWADDMVWVPTYHPAYALRNSHAVSMITADIKLAMDIRDGRVDMPVDPEWPDWEILEGCLIVKDESIHVEAIYRDIQPTFTQAEWARLRYAPSQVKDLVSMVKKTMGATLVK